MVHQNGFIAGRTQSGLSARLYSSRSKSQYNCSEFQFDSRNYLTMGAFLTGRWPEARILRLFGLNCPIVANLCENNSSLWLSPRGRI